MKLESKDDYQIVDAFEDKTIKGIMFRRPNNIGMKELICKLFPEINKRLFQESEYIWKTEDDNSVKCIFKEDIDVPDIYHFNNDVTYGNLHYGTIWLRDITGRSRSFQIVFYHYTEDNVSMVICRQLTDPMQNSVTQIQKDFIINGHKYKQKFINKE